MGIGGRKLKGVTLIITILVTAVMMMIMIYFIEKIMPISKSIKGIENGTVAYYEALSGVEKALLDMEKTNPGYEGSGSTLTGSVGYSFQVNAKSPQNPRPGMGDSDFSPDFNKILPGQPIQLAIGSGYFVGGNKDISIALRIPNIDNDCSNLPKLDGSGAIIVNWMLSGSGKTFYSASGITADMLNSTGRTESTSSDCERSYGMRFFLTDNAGIYPSYPPIATARDVFVGSGSDLEGTIGSFLTFYNGASPFTSTSGLGVKGSDCDVGKCSLKFSIVHSLKVNNESIPYLEYRVEFGDPTNGDSAPTDYANIVSDGFSRGFKRTVRRAIKQITTSEAFDFTVFQ